MASIDSSASARSEAHHQIPRCILRLQDRLDAMGPGEDTVTLWVEYEHECERFGVDAGVPRSQLAAFIEASTVLVSREEHRQLHEGCLQRWGRRGGKETFRRYGSAWFSLLALRRWKRISADELAAARVLTVPQGREDPS